jgi:uncharacterized protein YbjT (DUF2867 family)
MEERQAMVEETSPRERIVVVAGATGYLGRHLVVALRDRGWRVRALVRDEARLGFAREAAAEVFVGEATRPQTLAGLCDGADAVVSALGLRAMSGRLTVFDVDRDANLNVLAQARQAGVARFGFVSVLHGEGLRARVPQAEAREEVVDALRRGGPAWTVFRPTGFFNDMAEFFEMARAGRVWLVGDGTRRLNPIHGADLAGFIADALGREDAVEAELAVGGPETFNHREIGALAFDVLGRPPRFGKLPAALLRAAGAVTAPFSPNLSNVLRFMAAMGRVEAVAPPTGTHHLRPFFEALARGPAQEVLARR